MAGCHPFLMWPIPMKFSNRDPFRGKLRNDDGGVGWLVLNPYFERMVFDARKITKRLKVVKADSKQNWQNAPITNP